MRVIVIGAGWAGLAAATELAKHNIKVTVLESARQPGGRARAVKFGKLHIDNGQHILIGAYSGVLSVLRTLNIMESDVFRRSPLRLTLLKGNQCVGDLHTPVLPAPLHLLAGLIRFRGLSLLNRLRVLYGALRMRLEGFHAEPDCNLYDYLKARKQSSRIITLLWEPLCLAVMNTPITDASANLFLRVIKNTFFGERRDSDLLLPIADLGDCLPEPAMDYIERHGGTVHLATRAQSIVTTSGCITGVNTRNDTLTADHVIIATSHESCKQLIKGHVGLGHEIRQLDKLSSFPITTLYLQYPEDTQMPQDFAGLIDSTTQWLFDRGRLTKEHGVMAAVISGPGEHMSLDNDALTELMISEIARCFPDWPAPINTKLIREKRATLFAGLSVNNHRPMHTTPVNGLWFAGDYTRTGYPSTLEGAVRSGLRCAHAILQQQNTKRV